MMPINLIVDLDGSLAHRGHLPSDRMLVLILEVIRRGTAFHLLTGQNISDVRRRFVDPLRRLNRHDVPNLLARVGLFTCEGACAWRILPDGSVETDHSCDFAAEFRFSANERRKLSGLLAGCLAETLSECSLVLTKTPEWWENAILVFKVDGNLSNRIAASRRFAELISRHTLIRADVAGQTSIVIAKPAARKCVVFRQLLPQKWHRFTNVYIADEFMPQGNDCCTLDIEGLIRIGVDKDQSALPPTVIRAGSSGPEATERWFAEFLSASPADFSTAEELIRHVTHSVRENSPVPQAVSGTENEDVL